MKKGIVKQIDELPYGKMTLEGLEAMLEELTKSKPNSNKFQLTEYCSAEQYQELRTGADAFDRALMSECGSTKAEILKRDIREFCHRNPSMSDYNKVQYERCKNGWNDMTGQEYFYYNFCYINGRLPIRRDVDRNAFDEAFARYTAEVERMRTYKYNKECGNDEDKRHLERPRTPEECFRLQNKKSR